MKFSSYIEDLKKSDDERVTHLQPVNYKYLRWDQIKKYIIPISIDLSNKSMEEAQSFIHSFFEKNVLTRAVIDCNRDVHIKKNVNSPIEVYECSHEEADRISYDMAERMLNRDIYNELLFDCCIFKEKNSLLFYGLFNHLITDGKIDETIITGKEFDYYAFDAYLQTLQGEEKVDFKEYIEKKRELVDKYKSNKMKYYHFSLSDSKIMIKKGYTFEELWTLVLVDYLRCEMTSINDIPVNITSGGRKYNGLDINCFGDFHDDFIFVIKDEKTFIDNFRYYREFPYLNAKQYDEFLCNYKDISYSQYIEPVTISVKWDSDDYTSFQIVRKQLPPHAKNAIVGFNVLIEKNLKKVHIDVRASEKLDYLFKDFESKLYDCYKKVVGWD